MSFSSAHRDSCIHIETSMTLLHRYRKAKINCLSFVYVPATSATHNRLLFFFFLLRPFTVLMKKTHAVKQSIFLRCLCFTHRGFVRFSQSIQNKTFAVHWKHSSFWPSADVEPMSSDLMYATLAAMYTLSLYGYNTISMHSTQIS